MTNDEFLNDRDCTPRVSANEQPLTTAEECAYFSAHTASWQEFASALSNAVRNRLAEAEKAEPVAFMARCGFTGKAVFRPTGPEYPSIVGEVPLYTHPPASLPESAELSDEDCDDVILRVGLSYLVDASPTNRSVLHWLCHQAVAAARGKG